MSEQIETASLDKVIARIQKLLARSGLDGDKRGASENEAEIAASEVQRLMLKHNLDMATVQAASGVNAPAERVKEALSGKTRQKWQRDLANFCYYLLKEDYARDNEGQIIYLRGGLGPAKKVRSHVFVGRK